MIPGSRAYERYDDLKIVYAPQRARKYEYYLSYQSTQNVICAPGSRPSTRG